MVPAGGWQDRCSLRRPKTSPPLPVASESCRRAWQKQACRPPLRRRLLSSEARPGSPRYHPLSLPGPPRPAGAWRRQGAPTSLSPQGSSYPRTLASGLVALPPEDERGWAGVAGPAWQGRRGWAGEGRCCEEPPVLSAPSLVSLARGLLGQSSWLGKTLCSVCLPVSPLDHVHPNPEPAPIHSHRAEPNDEDVGRAPLFSVWSWLTQSQLCGAASCR